MIGAQTELMRLEFLERLHDDLVRVENRVGAVRTRRISLIDELMLRQTSFLA